MKKYYLALGLVLIITVLVVIKPKSHDASKKAVPIAINQPEKQNKITIIDTSSWGQSLLHQNITVLIPQNWSAGSDGVYNYDYTKVTGIRDPNFPNDSFKCVFYKDDRMRNSIQVLEEQIVNTKPKVTKILAKWQGSPIDTFRTIGEEITIYTHNSGVAETFVECNVFKGNMTEDDKLKMENVILSVK